MKLNNFENYTPPAVLDRGRGYLKNGNILHIEEKGGKGSDRWHAIVEGTYSDYEVEVHLSDDGTVTFSDCDCPYEFTGPCKHLVAVFLKIRKLRDPILPRAQKRTLQEQLQAYPKLSKTAQRVLKIASLAWTGLSQKTMLDIFKSCDFKHENKVLHAQPFQLIKQQLVQQGWLDSSNKGLEISETLANALCDGYYSSDPEFSKIAQEVLKIRTLQSWYQRFDPQEYFRNMRIGRYEDNLGLFRSHFKHLSAPDYGPHQPEELLDYWLGDQPSIERWLEFGPNIRAYLATEWLQTQTFKLSPVGEGTLSMLAELLPNADDITLKTNLSHALFHAWLLRDNWKAIELILPHFTPSFQQGVIAIRQLLNGQYNEAQESFQEAAKWAKRSKELDKQSYQETLFALFHQLTRLQSRDKAEIARLLSPKAAPQKLNAQIYLYLQAAGFFLTNEPAQAAVLLKHRSSFAFTDFFRMLSQYWVDANQLASEQVINLAASSYEKGYLFISQQLNALLQKMEQPTQGDGKLPNGTPLVQLLPQIEPWEMALSSLEALFSTETGNEENRLVWLVDFSQHTLEPRHQSFGKNGWSSGRKVIFHRLQSRELPFLKPQDLQFVNALGHRAGTLISIKYDQQYWKHLIGHPLLFLQKSPSTPVQLVEGKTSLVAEQVGDHYQLSFSHNMTKAGVQIVKETPTRYLYLEITEQMAQVANAFNGKTLQIPAQAEEKLRTVLTGLSKILPVQSAFENENLPKVEADPRIYVHLLPMGDGFSLETYVKPFRIIPPYLKPGNGVPFLIGLIDGARTGTTRNLAEEKKRLKELMNACPSLHTTKAQKDIRELSDPTACLQLLLELGPLVEAEKIVLEWPKGQQLQVQGTADFSNFNMSIQKKGHWFEVDGSVKVNEEQVLSLQELLELAENSSNFIELSPGKFLALTREFQEKLKSISGMLQKDATNSPLKVHPLGTTALEDFTASVQHLKTDQAFKEQGEQLQKAFRKRFRVPTNFQATLRSYQEEGFQWLCRCAEGGVGACLADDMGLGKTIQALALLSKRATLGPALVVAPASVCRNWIAEAQRFAPSLEPILFSESDRQQTVKKAKKGQMIVLTYDLMAREESLLTEKKWATVLLDEAQAIKNYSTKRSEVAMQLEADFRLAMTGTPIENHLGELWNLFQFLNPGLLGNQKSFQERFAIPIERYKDDNRRNQLRRLVQPFILRRRKDEVLKELPEKTEITLTVELPPEERAHYEALRRTAIQKLTESQDEHGGQQHLRILAEIMRLRRAACHPSLVNVNLGFNKSAKLELFLEIVDELRDNGHKALVFSQFVDHLKILEKELIRKGIPYQYLDGSTPGKKRQLAIDAFQAGEGDIFLISLKAGGTGLTLTAADYVIHTDPWWNPAVEDQATDRAHRIGQQRPVTVYRLVASQTIEEKILQLHAQKRDLADSLLAGTDISAKLTADDLMNLLQES